MRWHCDRPSKTWGLQIVDSCNEEAFDEVLAGEVEKAKTWAEHEKTNCEKEKMNADTKQEEILQKSEVED